MGSLSPLATKTGRSIAASRWSSEWLGMPQAQAASYCAWRVCQVVGSSRSVVLAPKMRPAACWPPSRLVSVGAKKTDRYPSGVTSGTPTRSDDLWRPAVHPGCALWRGRGEHDAPEQVGADE